MTAVAAPPLNLNPQARRLTYWGLVPFVIGTVLAWLVADRNLDAHAFVMLALSVYAAVTISFLGGIYCGLAFRQTVTTPPNLMWALAPALLAWVAVLMPAYAGLVVHGAVLVIGYLIDRRFYPSLGASAWLVLRFRFSAAAAFCCFLAAAGS